MAEAVRQVGPEPVLEVVHEREEERGEQRGRDADHGSEPDELEVRGAAEVVLLFGQAAASLRPQAGGLRHAEPLRQAIEHVGARLEAAVGGDGRQRDRERAADDAHLPDEVPAAGIGAPAALELHVLAEHAEPPALLAERRGAGGLESRRRAEGPASAAISCT